MARDYKDEYSKFQSSKKMKIKRAKLNKYNRDKGTYGNGDGLDASHDKDGKIKGFVDSSTNKGKKEKSRMKDSKRKKYQKGGKLKKDFKPHTMYKNGKSEKANTYEEHLDLDKKGWSHNKYQKGGKLKGPSHEEGGILIEAEGDEIVVNSTKNGAAIKHEDGLLALNKEPDEWEIVPKNDARKRSKNHA